MFVFFTNACSVCQFQEFKEVLGGVETLKNLFLMIKATLTNPPSNAGKRLNRLKLLLCLSISQTNPINVFHRSICFDFILSFQVYVEIFPKKNLNLLHFLCSVKLYRSNSCQAYVIRR